MLVLGERYRQRLGDALRRYTDDVFWLPDNPALDKRLAGHADLSLFAVENQAVIAQSGEYDGFVNCLTIRGFTVNRSAKQEAAYPHDAGLCVCSTGDYAIFNPKTADPSVLKILRGKKIHVSQGYTACSVCVLNENSIITSDRRIAEGSKQAGMNVLHISEGHIILEGFDTGFIGGASFRIRNSALAFTGTLNRHPDKDRILRFITQQGLEAVFLTDDPVFDIGGAIGVP